jgi:hypothetical protein
MDILNHAQRPVKMSTRKRREEFLTIEQKFAIKAKIKQFQGPRVDVLVKNKRVVENGFTFRNSGT